MANAYRIYDQFGVHFVTFTVNQWVDVFTRKDYKDILIDSLKFCQLKKGLEIYSWVIMTNHIHLIISSNGERLSDIIRDYKKFTSSKIIRAIENNPLESRKKWLLWLLKNNGEIDFWQDGYHGEEITSDKFYETKEDYIHQNPVRAGIVEKDEDYIFSSYPDRIGIRKNILELADF